MTKDEVQHSRMTFYEAVMVGGWSYWQEGAQLNNGVMICSAYR